MKKYQYTKDGVLKTKTVSAEQETAFLALCEKENIVPTLVSEESGKDQGSASDAGVTKPTKASKVDENIATNFIGPTNKKDSESTSDDGSLESNIDDSLELEEFTPEESDYAKREKKRKSNLELLDLDDTALIKQLKESGEYEGLGVSQFGDANSGMVMITLPNGDRKRIKLSQAKSGVPGEPVDLNESLNVLNWVDDYYAENKDKPGSMLIGSIFNTGDYHEVPDMESINNTLESGGYKIEGEDGNYQVMRWVDNSSEVAADPTKTLVGKWENIKEVDAKTEQDGLNAVKKHLINEITEDEASKIVNVANHKIKKDIYDFSETATNVAFGKFETLDPITNEPTGKYDYNNITDESVVEQLFESSRNKESHVIQHMDIAVNSQYSINNDGEVVSEGPRLVPMKEGDNDWDGDGVPNAIDNTPQGNLGMSDEGKKIAMDYLRGHSIKELEVVLDSLPTSKQEYEARREGDMGTTKSRYEDLNDPDNPIYSQLNPNDAKILRQIIADKVGWDDQTVLNKKSEIADDFRSNYTTSLIADASEESEILYNIAIEAGDNVLVARKKVLENDSKILFKDAEEFKKGSDIEFDEINKFAQKNNLSITVEGDGINAYHVVDGSNYFNEQEATEIKNQLDIYVNDMDVIKGRLEGDNSYENQVKSKQAEIDKILAGNYTTKEQTDRANKKIEILRNDIQALANDYETDVNDYNDKLTLHNDLFAEFDKDNKTKGEEMAAILQARLDEQWGYTKKFYSEYEKGSSKILEERQLLFADWQEYNMTADALAREHDLGDLLLEDWANAKDGIAYGTLAIFGHKKSIDYLNKIREGADIGLEKYMTVSEARAVNKRATGGKGAYMQWRRTARMTAQQAPVIVAAIGSASLFGPVAGNTIYAVVTGLQSGGQNKAALYSMVDAKEDAQISLNKLHANEGSMAPSVFREQKIALETIIAQGNMSPAEINLASWTAAAIEGGVMWGFGKLGYGKFGDSMRIVKMFQKTKPKNLIDIANTTRMSILFDATKSILGRSAAEVAEEEIIYFATEASQSLILGKEADYSMGWDVAWDSMILGGGMNVAPTVYTAATTAVVGDEARAQLNDLKTDMKRVQDDLASLKPGKKDANRRSQLQLEMEELINKIGFLQTGLEVDVLLAGPDGMKVILSNSVDLRALYAEAGVNFGDNQNTIDKKTEEYKAKLIKEGDADGARDFQSRLDGANKAINDIKNKTRNKLENSEAEDLILEQYGNKGLEVWQKLLAKNPANADLDLRDQLALVHKDIQKNFENAIIREVKGDKVVQSHVEYNVYGKLLQKWVDSQLYGKVDKDTKRDLEAEKKLKEQAFENGIFNTLQREGLIKNRKTKEENNIYYTNARYINSQRISAAQTFVDGQQSLTQVIKANGGLDAIRNLEITAFKSAAEIKKVLDGMPDYYFEQAAQQQGVSIQQVKNDMLQGFKDGTNKGMIFDGKYIIMGEKDAAQRELNNISGIISPNQSHMLMGTVFLHEFSHALDGVTMKEGEVKQFAGNLAGALVVDKDLQVIHTLAINRLSNLVGPDGNPLYKDELDFENQSELFHDEYIKSVQDLLQNKNNRDLLRAAEKKSKQSIGNMVRGTILGRIPVLGKDFKLNTKGDALKFVTSHIRSFQKGKLSDLVKRKITAKDVANRKLKYTVNKLSAKKDNNTITKKETAELNRAKETLDNMEDVGPKKSAENKKRRDTKRKVDQFVQNPDGTPRFKNNNEFINHDNGRTRGKAAASIRGIEEDLDGRQTIKKFTGDSRDIIDIEIQKGMSAKGIPSGSAMNEFTNRVREVLHDRFLTNFDYDAIKPITADIDGILFYKRNAKGEIVGVEIESDDGTRKEYKLPKTKESIVPEGTMVNKGDAITEGASIFGWLFGYAIDVAKLDVQKKYVKELQTGEAGAFDVDATTAEGAPVMQIDSGVDLDTTIDDVLRTDKEIEQVNLLKDDLELDDNFREELKNSVISTFRKVGVLPDFDSPQFKEAIKKEYVNLLTDKVKKMMGTRDKHVQFLKKHREAIINILPISDLVAMQRELGVDIFATKVGELRTVDTVQNAIDQGIIGPEMKGQDKVAIYDKLTPSETDFLAFFFPPLKTPEGKKDNTRGERKTALSGRLGAILGMQETIPTITESKVQQSIDDRLKALGRSTIDENIDNIKRAVEQNPKYKHSLDVRHVQQLANIIEAEGLANVIVDGKLAPGIEIDGISQTSINITQHLFEKGNINEQVTAGFIANMLKSTVIDVDTKGEYISDGTLHRDNDTALEPFSKEMIILMDELKLNLPQQGSLRFDLFGFTSRYMNPGFDTKYDVSYNAEFQGMMGLFGDIVSKIPGVDIDAINIMNKNAKGVFQNVISILESNKTRADKMIELEKLRPTIDAANTSNINLFKHIIKGVKKLVDSGEMSKVGAIHFLQMQTNIVMGLRGLSRLDLMYVTDGSQALYVNKKGKPTNSKFRTENKKQVANEINPNMLPMIKEATEFYKKKGKGKGKKFKELTNKEARAKAIENLIWKGEHLGPSANTLGGMLDLILGGKITDAKMNAEMDRLLDGHSQLIAPKYITDLIDEGGRNNTTNFHRVKFLPKQHINNIVDTKGGSYTDFMINRITKEQKIFAKLSSDRSSNNEILNQALDNRTTYLMSQDVRGASIFDFDDTLAFTKSGVRARVPNRDGQPKPKRKVVFLAGGAGSGKGNVVSKLGLEKQGFKIVNQDISLEWLKKNHGLPENMNDLNKEQKSILGKLGHQARGIAKRKMMKFQGQGDGVVVDGTGASLKQMQKLVAEFEAKGYDVSMVFVETSLDVALERNRARPERSLLDFIVKKNHESVMGNKESFKEIFGETFMEVNTDNLKQEDSMPKELTDKMDNFVKGHEVLRLDAEQFAEQGTSILEAGGIFDFSEFNDVVDGTPGPSLEKARERIKKFGNKDVFVLTARPAESASAIQAFLKDQGIDIPIENITGLANSDFNAKAMWVLGKFAEGYNDMYFVDDALGNVEAVKTVLDQLDVKSKVVQAKVKFSQDMGNKFNTILERVMGVPANKIVSMAEARRLGQTAGGFDIFIPPSAEDFKGLLYKFLGKGKEGEADMQFFKEALLDPFAKAINSYNTYKQSMVDDYAALRKTYPDVSKKLNKNVPGTNFTFDSAIRVYLFNKAGFDVPGISPELKNTLINQVENDPQMKGFADELSKITKTKDGYIAPSNNWSIETITSDLNTVVGGVGRKQFLQDWVDNKDIIFSPDNLNKIESIYGTGFTDALKGMLYKMETGRNRIQGKDKLVNGFLDWINGSVGAVMFFNIRSAALQTISMVNFINFEDNNIFAAAKGFANQPQFWSDFATIFNSDMLKQRRAGLAIDVSASELTNVFAEGGKTHIQKARAVIKHLLEIGFTPTRIADSFAIAMGGSTFYRNRINKLMKNGMSKADAEKQAFLDFQEVAEETQQSSRPDLISMQQSGTLGRIILAWQNTPMQMTRLTKKAIADLYYKRGNWKANVSKIMYYGVVQNLIFGALQSGLMFAMFGGNEDEEDMDKKERRVLNTALDSLLRGTGVYGAAVATLKNVILKYQEQEEKGFMADHTYTIIEAINFSPPIGSKIRKIYGAIQTKRFNEGVSEKLGWRIENPKLSIAANVTEALTNIPLARLVNKANNVEEALTGNHEMWQRVAMISGWNRWDLGVKDEELEAAKAEVKVEKKEKKKQQKIIDKQSEHKEMEKKGFKKIQCSGMNSAGQRCGLVSQYIKEKTWKCMHHMKFEDGMDRDNDGLKEYRCTATKTNGEQCKNKTENKNKKCYAHQ